MTVSQSSFRAALLDADLAVPAGLQTPDGRPAGARFSVYRNNVVVSLTEALATAFPLVRKLIGGESFGRLAAVFVRDHPPSSPLMMFYGAQLPGFIEGFAPLKHIGYLADCARLDLAMREAYHAADATPFDATRFQNDPAGILAERVSLAPALRVLRSPWPVHDIWRFTLQEAAPKPRAVAQDVMIARPDFDPVPHLLPTGMADWLAQLQGGATLCQASETVLETQPAFDLTAALSLALSTAALAELTTKETE